MIDSNPQEKYDPYKAPWLMESQGRRARSTPFIGPRQKGRSLDQWRFDKNPFVKPSRSKKSRIEKPTSTTAVRGRSKKRTLERKKKRFAGIGSRDSTKANTVVAPISSSPKEGLRSPKESSKNSLLIKGLLALGIVGVVGIIAVVVHKNNFPKQVVPNGYTS